MRARLVELTASLLTAAALLAFASSAMAEPPALVGFPVRKWSVSKIEQGVGKVPLGHGRERSGDLNEIFDLGPAAFNLGPLPPLRDRAASWVSSRNDGIRPFVMAQAPVVNPFVPRSVKGGVAHLDQYQTYEKPTKNPDPFIVVSIKDLLLETVDENGPLTQSECPVVGTAPCSSIQAIARFRVRGFPKGGKHDFFDSGGAVFASGHEHAWFVGAATLTDSRRPFFPDAQFQVNGDVDHNGSGRRSRVRLVDGQPLVMQLPLGSVDGGQQFVVKVTLDAQAIDDRGHESGAIAFIMDPQHAAPGPTARGLGARDARSNEPPIRPRPAARCPAGPRPHAGTVQLSRRAFTVGEASGIPLALVTRTSGSRGATSVTVETNGGTARSGRDFTRTRTRVRFGNGDTSPRLLEIPIREDLAAESPETFTVSLADVRCAGLGARRRATVTILDDDQPPPPPAPEFTIGGAVDGLQGSGLVLSNLGAELPVSGNGSFTFPGTATDGQTYEVNVKTQPHNPDQVCTVEHGAGHVAGANVGDVGVHCATLATSGLDTGFGSGGRVSTSVGGGQAEAVVIQPTGGIVTAGRRTVGAGTDFALTRHTADGSIDPSFGTGGIATTDFGGASDQAHDAALLSDGGIVAVGETDAPGIQRQDFALARYNADGSPNTSFGAGGKVTTDISGHGDIANAVAVQGDGKIVVAGFVTPSGAHSDFALARYNADGTLDQSFGGGIVTTNFGALSDDDVRALTIQPDGRIVAAGTAGEDIALARYTPNGTVDPTFGNSGTTVTNLGFTDVANGVTMTPFGGIIVAGHTIGTRLDNDFLLVRYGLNGELDKGFGILGVVKTDFGAGADFAENLAVDAAGRIVVVGRAASPTVSDMALARYTPDGTPDLGFAGGGILTADFHGAGDSGLDLALDAAGRIVAAGSTADGPDAEFALMRANP